MAWRPRSLLLLLFALDLAHAFLLSDDSRSMGSGYEDGPRESAVFSVSEAPVQGDVMDAERIAMSRTKRNSATSEVIQKHDALLEDLKRQEEEILQRREEADKEFEEAKAATENRAAERAAADQAQEAAQEITRRADQQRRATEESVAPEIEDYSFTPGYSVAAEDLTSMSDDLLQAVKDRRLGLKVEKALKGLSWSLAKLQKGWQTSLRNFERAGWKVRKQDLLPFMRRFVSEEWYQPLLQHQEVSSEYSLDIEDAMPPQMRLIFGPMMHLMSRNIAPHFNASRLAEISDAAEFCQEVSMVANNYTEKIAQIRGMLNSTTRLVPDVGSKADGAVMSGGFRNGVILTLAQKWLMSSEITALLHNSVNLGFAEFMVLEDAARDLLARAGPVMEARLGCAFTISASSRLRAGGSMPLLLAVAALTRVLNQRWM